MKPRIKIILLKLLVAADPSPLTETILIEQAQSAAQPMHPSPSDVRTCIHELAGRHLIVGTYNDVLEVSTYNLTPAGKNFLAANL